MLLAYFLTDCTYAAIDVNGNALGKALQNVFTNIHSSASLSSL